MSCFLWLIFCDHLEDLIWGIIPHLFQILESLLNTKLLSQLEQHPRERCLTVNRKSKIFLIRDAVVFAPNVVEFGEMSIHFLFARIECVLDLWEVAEQLGFFSAQNERKEILGIE